LAIAYEKSVLRIRRARGDVREFERVRIDRGNVSALIDEHYRIIRRDRINVALFRIAPVERDESLRDDPFALLFFGDGFSDLGLQIGNRFYGGRVDVNVQRPHQAKRAQVIVRVNDARRQRLGRAGQSLWFAPRRAREIASVVPVRRIKPSLSAIACAMVVTRGPA